MPIEESITARVKRLQTEANKVGAASEEAPPGAAIGSVHDPILGRMVIERLHQADPTFPDVAAALAAIPESLKRAFRDIIEENQIATEKVRRLAATLEQRVIEEQNDADAHAAEVAALEEKIADLSQQRDAAVSENETLLKQRGQSKERVEWLTASVKSYSKRLKETEQALQKLKDEQAAAADTRKRKSPQEDDHEGRTVGLFGKMDPKSSASRAVRPKK